jgi:DNA-binding CsgD family transcriptional regulator
LVEPSDDAESLYVASIEQLAATESLPEVARSRLLYGEWLRRKRRRREARVQLNLAYVIFDSLGATAFAERARIELAATGVEARSRTVATLHDLTPQEEQIARFAASGATNPEIAAQMFLSASTVEYHLRKVFRKLDISSRRQLKAALNLDA